ncbi:MAG TPA: hypothetical protein VGY57_00355 [Vicinamibacterales bacterium]|nr:hypothetical protein [Vicinamibacterales bacterium]
MVTSGDARTRDSQDRRRVGGRNDQADRLNAMWQPNPRQWPIIWTVTVLLALAWPPSAGRSLGMKIVNWAADPAGSLPAFPPPLPIGLDDDGDAVAAHDARESEYYRVRNSSRLNRWRMNMKSARDPIDPTTERQMLIGIAALSALVVWRLEAGRLTQSSQNKTST